MIKYICLLITAIAIMAGTTSPSFDSYDKMWTTVEELEHKGLVRSALTEVERIFERSISEENYPNWVKSYLFIQKFTAQLEEEGEAKVLLRMEKDIPDMPQPVRSILRHYAGQYYHQYMMARRNQHSSRTELLVEDENDIRTWSTDKLEARFRFHLAEALTWPGLKDIPTADYKLLLHKASRVSWTTSLKDQLIHQSLTLLAQNEQLHKSVNKFEIDSNVVYLPASEFIKSELSQQDTTDYAYISFRLYQQWLADHVDGDDKIKALINAERLNYADQQLHQSLAYLSALESARANSEHPCVYDYYIAQHYVGIGSRYSVAAIEENRLALVKAHEVAQSCGDCEGLESACQQLIKQLEQASLSISIQAVNPILKPISIQVNARNLTTAYYSIYTLNDQNWFEEFYKDGKLKLPKGTEKIKSGSIALMPEIDYQSHRINAELDGLPSGAYVVIVSPKPNINDKFKDVRSEVYKFQVSDMVLLDRREPGKHSFYITHRITGQPLPGVQIKQYLQAPYPAKGLTEIINTSRSDQDGAYYESITDEKKIRRRSRDRHMHILTRDNDRLIVDRNYYIHNINNGGQHRPWTTFFTDRSIYRPGQTVHFKGIHFNRSPEQINTIVPNKELNVTMRDANNKEVAAQTFATNDFGSFSGSFTIPIGSLNGRFMIRTTGGKQAIQVEQYKRPTFEAVFDTLKGDYVIGEDILVSGLAKNLAGNVLQNARGSYRIVRSVYFPFGYDSHFFKRSFPYFRTTEEIANGGLVIKDDGTFAISFSSSKDDHISRIYRAAYTYQIEVTIIDETGESHDFTEHITVGPTAVTVHINHPDKIDLSGNEKVEIKASNYNQIPKSIGGELMINRMVNPDRYEPPMLWPVPDIVLDNSDSNSSSWTYYKDASEPKKWKVGEQIAREKFLINDKNSFSLSKYNLVPGTYRILFEGLDSFGNTVKTTSYVDVYDSQEGTLPAYQHHIIKWDKRDYEPGDKFTLDIYSTDQIFVLIAEDKASHIGKPKWVSVKGYKQLLFDITEADRGNLTIQVFMVHDGRLVQKAIIVSVPWSNKDLKIEYLSFRDELIPGQKEKWIVKLSGTKKDIVAAEMVASLYDASLDAFKNHEWSAHFYPTNSARSYWASFGFDRRQGYSRDIYPDDYHRIIQMSSFNLFNVINPYGHGGGRVMMRRTMAGAPKAEAMNVEGNESGNYDMAKMSDADASSLKEGQIADNTIAEKLTAPLVRTNLQETAFFYPSLRTDGEGNVLIEFTMGEALTKWKLLTFAHTQSLEYVFDTKELVTKKDFMVFPLFPRFFREYDQITLKSKVVNLTDQPQQISVDLILQDGITKVDQTDLFKLNNKTVEVTLKPQSSTTVSWDVRIPAVTDLSAVTAQVIARSNDMSDGEQHLIPILTNRKLVKEALALPLKGMETREWTLSELRDLMSSASAEVHQVALEVSSNPAWYAVLALPYLHDQINESTTDKMDRLYANQLASFVIDQNPKIKNVFAQWQQAIQPDDFNAFLSHLNKNQELKYVVLNQTPWVAEAKNEEDQRRRIALLFDMNNLTQQQQQIWSSLQQAQNRDGGFSWMPGGRSNWYTTINVLSRLAHLKELGAMNVSQLAGVQSLIQRAVMYSDAQLHDYIQHLKRNEERGTTKLSDDHLTQPIIYHLYVRSQFQDIAFNNAGYKDNTDYMLDQSEEYWSVKNIYAQGQIALILDKYNRKKELPILLQSLQERSLTHDELGRYWKYDNGYSWYQRPIETQALMIEVFHKLSDDQFFIEELKIWLLKHKQTNSWSSSAATAEAVFALLATGPSLLQSDQLVQSYLSGKAISPDRAQAGTGYYKETWGGTDITTDLTKVKLVNPNDQIAYGGIYWQYFEDLDKIKTFKKTPITIDKSLTKKIMTDQGPKLSPLSSDNELAIGDRVVVRIEIRVDRDMEFVHLQDMRSSGLEPTHIISGYRWQDGLGYYQTIKDASADFFIDFLPKGTFVFEYELKVSHTGQFSNGITTIQSYYAPEFTSHSEGERISVR